MQTFNNVHQQFAEFFRSETMKPFAYLVSKKLAEGHICLDLDEVQEEPGDQSFYHQQDVRDRLNDLVKEPLVTSANGLLQPFVLHNRKLYLQRYFKYESQILERLQAFIMAEKEQLPERVATVKSHSSFIRSLFAAKPQSKSSEAIENIDWQLAAAVSAVLNDFTIITGGPGTGKTTTVAKILAILYTINPALKVALAAPTGKAAARMAESLKSASLNVTEEINLKFESIVPGTIHRLLKYVPDSPYFRHNKDNPVNYDVIIADESSMIDVALFAKLLDATGANTKLILLGDKNQLASVEAGSLFGDLCNAIPPSLVSNERADLINSLIADPSSKITADCIAGNNSHLLFQHIVELKRSHRFSSDKGIGKFSKAVINSDQQQIITFLKNDDEQVIIDAVYNERIFEEFIQAYETYIKEPDIKEALKKLNNLRVLCAIREGGHGLYAANKKIEKYLQQKKLIKPTTEFYEHRPVLVTRNYYDLNLFNGDVGIIRYDGNNTLKAWFEDSSGELKQVLPGFIAGVETVYAMTIHKSQGSEYDQVLVILPDAADIALLTAELLYTGVTRAKTKVIVQATENVILETAQRRVKRASGIVERFEDVQ